MPRKHAIAERCAPVRELAGRLRGGAVVRVRATNDPCPEVDIE